MRACFLNFKAPHLAKFSWCVSTDLASQGWLKKFCSRFTMNRQGMVQFPGFTFFWPNFWLSFDIGHSFGPWQSPCITQAVTNLKAGQSWGPEKVCLQPSICSGVSRDAWRHSKHFKQPLDSLSGAFYFGSWILKAFQAFQVTIGFIV